MDFYHLFGYLSGLLFIQPDLDSTSLIRTGALIHFLDAIICLVIAGQSRRPRVPWTLAGLVFGIWALGALFLLPANARSNQ